MFCCKRRAVGIYVCWARHMPARTLRVLPLPRRRAAVRLTITCCVADCAPGSSWSFVGSQASVLPAPQAGAHDPAVWSGSRPSYISPPACPSWAPLGRLTACTRLHHPCTVPAASGKTQLCLTAAASAARQAKRVVYIDTSNALRGKRLQQVVEALPPLMLQPGQVRWRLRLREAVKGTNMSCRQNLMGMPVREGAAEGSWLPCVQHNTLPCRWC